MAPAEKGVSGGCSVAGGAVLVVVKGASEVEIISPCLRMRKKKETTCTLC